MTEETGGGSTTINQYPNNNGWGGPGGWGGWGYPVPTYPAYGYGNGGFGGFGDLMRGFGGNINIGRGNAAGIALGTVGTALAGLLALGAVSGRGGGLFGGPGGPGCDNLVTKDYLGLVKENSALQAQIAQKDAKIYTDEKITDVTKFFIEWRQRQELIDAQTAADVATLKNENANLKATLGNMLGTYIQPGTFAPSQAVFTAMQNVAAAKAGGQTGGQTING